MTFAYNPSLPNPPDDPGDDVAGMQINAASINSIIAVDHVGFNVAGGGEHKQVTFNSNNVPSVPTSPPVLFTNLVNSLPQLFFYTGDAAQSQNQYVSSGDGSTMILGGIILKWGTSATLGSPSNFPVAFPNNCFVVVITGISSLYTGGFVVTAKTASSFTAVRTNGSGATGFNYIAIGN